MSKLTAFLQNIVAFLLIFVSFMAMYSAAMYADGVLPARIFIGWGSLALFGYLCYSIIMEATK